MTYCMKCGDSYNPRRAELGYKTCLECGSPRINFTVVPIPKSNYVVGTMDDLKSSYNVKGQR